MSLPPSQQHVLNEIEDGLQGTDPRLARMFAVFTRLTRQEGMPARETLNPRRWARPAWRVGRLVVVPLLLAATLSLLIMSILGAPSPGRGQCGPAADRSAVYGTLAPLGCRPPARAGAAQNTK